MRLPADRFDFERVANLMTAEDWEGCNNLTKRLLETMEKPSVYLLWVRGICEDMLGNPFEGLLNFKRALEIDPANMPVLRSMGENLEMFRAGLLHSFENPGFLEYVEQVHEFLTAQGEFGTTHQFLVVKNYIKYGAYQKAQNVLHGYLVNNQNDPEALALERLVDLALDNRKIC